MEIEKHVTKAGHAMSARVPPFMTLSELAKVLRMSYQRARRLLMATNCVEKVGTGLLVPTAKLRENVPHLFDALLDIEQENEDNRKA